MLLKRHIFSLLFLGKGYSKSFGNRRSNVGEMEDFFFRRSLVVNSDVIYLKKKTGTEQSFCKNK